MNALAVKQKHDQPQSFEDQDFPEFPKRPAQKQNRLEWIDAAKGVGILLVVLGHVVQTGRMHEIIFMFHMPLFFIISGLMWKSRSVGDVWQSGIRRFLPPYIFYLVSIGVLYQTYVTYKEFHGLHGWGWIISRSLFDLLYGGQHLKGAMAVFWFVPVLWACQLIYAGFESKVKQPKPMAVWFGFFALALLAREIVPQLSDWSNPLDLAVVPIVLVFFYTGVMLAGKNFLDKRTIMFSLVIAAVSLAISYMGYVVGYATIPLQKVDLKFAEIVIPVVGIASAIALSVLVLAVCKAASGSTKVQAFLSYLGKASMTIMYVHGPIIFLCAMINGSRPGLVPIWAQCVLAVVIPLVWEKLINKSKFLRGLITWQ